MGAPQKRSVPSFYPWYSGPDSSVLNEAGETVTVRKGEALDVVFSCLHTLAREIASTKCQIRKETANGRLLDKSHPTYKLLTLRPNRFMSAFNWHYSNVWLYNAWGDSYNLIIRDGNGMPTELIPLMPWETELRIVEGEVFYVHKQNVYPARDVLHYKQYTRDGIRGISPIRWNAELMGHKFKQRKYASRVLGSKPAVYMTSDVATDEQLNKAVQSWNTAVQGDEITGTPFLPGMFKVQQLMINPEDGQFIQTAEYDDNKILSIFNVPPNFVQDYKDGIKANSEQQAIVLVKHTLTPHYELIEQENNYKLFPDRQQSGSNRIYTKFNVNSKLRGDIKTRFESYHMGVNDGYMTLNQVRELEDWEKGPEELDKYYQNGNFAEVGKGPMMEADRALLRAIEKKLKLQNGGRLHSEN